MTQLIQVHTGKKKKKCVVFARWGKWLKGFSNCRPGVLFHIKCSRTNKCGQKCRSILKNNTVPVGCGEYFNSSLFLDADSSTRISIWWGFTVVRVLEWWWTFSLPHLTKPHPRILHVVALPSLQIFLDLSSLSRSSWTKYQVFVGGYFLPPTRRLCFLVWLLQCQQDYKY